MPDVILRGAWDVGDDLGGDWTGEKLDKAHFIAIDGAETFGGDFENLYDKAGFCDAAIASFGGDFTPAKDIASSATFITGMRFGGDFRLGSSKVFSLTMIGEGINGNFNLSQDKGDFSNVDIAPIEVQSFAIAADRYDTIDIASGQYFLGDWHPLMRSALPIPPIGHLSILGFVGSEELQGAFIQTGTTKVLELEVIGMHLDACTQPEWNTFLHFVVSPSPTNLIQTPLIHKSTAPSPGGISIRGVDTNYATDNGTVHRLIAQIPLSPQDLFVPEPMAVFFDAWLEIKGMDERYSLLPYGPGSFTLLTGSYKR